MEGTKNVIKSLVIVSLVVFLPYCAILSLQLVVLLGKVLDVTDSDVMCGMMQSQSKIQGKGYEERKEEELSEEARKKVGREKHGKMDVQPIARHGGGALEHEEDESRYVAKL